MYSTTEDCASKEDSFYDSSCIHTSITISRRLQLWRLNGLLLMPNRTPISDQADKVFST